MLSIMNSYSLPPCSMPLRNFCFEENRGSSGLVLCLYFERRSGERPSQRLSQKNKNEKDASSTRSETSKSSFPRKRESRRRNLDVKGYTLNGYKLVIFKVGNLPVWKLAVGLFPVRQSQTPVFGDPICRFRCTKTEMSHPA